MNRGTVVAGLLDPGQWSATFGLAYRDLCLYDAVGPQRIVRPGGRELRQMCGAAGISEGRNAIAATFLDDTDGEWLWFVDTDMSFAPDTVDRLLTAADPYQMPVMGGLCFALRRTRPGTVDSLYAPTFTIVPTLYAYTELEDELGFVPLADYGRDQVVKVAGTGAACLLIHRRALDKVRAKHGDAWFDPVIHPSGYRGGRRAFSEDLSFCIRLAGVGVPVHVDTRVKTAHEKGGVYLTEEIYDRERVLTQREEVADGGRDRGAIRDVVGA